MKEQDSAISYRGTPLERFCRKVIKQPSGCWEWLGGDNGHGYGLFWYGNRLVKAARFAYEQTHGIIPDGLQLDHLCRNHKCVNPQHLEPVTGSMNTKRGLLPLISGINGRNYQLSKTHCPKGHPYDLSNTYLTVEGWRVCRICKREGNLKCRMSKK